MTESPSLRPSNRKFAATLAGVVAVVALLGLFLSMCSGDKRPVSPTPPSQAAADAAPAPSTAQSPAYQELPEVTRARRIAEWKKSRLHRQAAKKAADTASERAAERDAERVAKRAAKRAALRNKRNRDEQPKVAELETAPKEKRGRMVRVDMKYPTANAENVIVMPQTVPILPVLQWDHDKEEYPEAPH